EAPVPTMLPGITNEPGKRTAVAPRRSVCTPGCDLSMLMQTIRQEVPHGTTQTRVEEEPETPPGGAEAALPHRETGGAHRAEARDLPLQQGYAYRQVQDLTIPRLLPRPIRVALGYRHKVVTSGKGLGPFPDLSLKHREKAPCRSLQHSFRLDGPIWSR